MKGKIFPESSNVYQDQAKILFNYYQSMAEKIVQEEERIEKEIATLEEDKLILNQDLSKAVLWKWILCILIIPYIIFLLKEKGIIKQLDSIDGRIVEFQKLHSEIFRDYKVSKLGVAYVPIASQIKYENKSFMVDHTGLVGESEVKLQLSKQNDLLIEKIADLEKLSAEAPLVESSNEIEEIDTEEYSLSMQQLNQHDYFGNLERSLRTISYCMDDLDVTSVSLPLVANNSSYVDLIKEYATSEVPVGSPVFEVFDTQKYNDDIAKFQELNKLKDSLSRHSAQFEDVLKGLMVTMANSVQAISALKVASTNKIVFESNKVLYKILKSPYNHYSPALEASEIERIRNESFNYGDSVQDYVPFQLKESSRVRYNMLSDTWVAEDGSSTNFPFGIHQIHEEIVAPMVQNLMNETRIERLKIYNHIKDQKISYLNKWHQDTEDFYGRNRAESADLINLMRASLRDYVAAYNTMASLKKTEDSMSQSEGSLDSTVVTAASNEAEVFAAFEIQSKEFQNVQLEFESYMERLKDDIDNKAAKFEHIDYYDALLRDGNSRDTAVASSELHDLDERRKPLISINPLFAKTSEMLPEPSVENIIYEHMSLNLPNIAKNALRELDEDLVTPPATNDEITNSDVSSVNTQESQIDDVSTPSIKEKDIINEIGEQKEDVIEIKPNIKENADNLKDDNEVEFIEEDEELEKEDDVEMLDEEEMIDEEILIDYSREDLEKLSDSEIKFILSKLGSEPIVDFNRTEAIEAILEEQGFIEDEAGNEAEPPEEESTPDDNPASIDQNVCPNCKAVNGPEYMFCTKCGQKLSKK
jgi:hypothetical protein